MGDAHIDSDGDEKRCLAYINFLEAVINHIEKPTRETQKQIQMTVLDAIHCVSEEKYFEFEFKKGEEFFERIQHKSRLLRNFDFQELSKFISVISPYKKFSKKITDFIEKMAPEE